MVVSAPATTLHQARPATKATLDAFEALGIAVFPQEVGRKGSRVHGWPEMPTDTAIALTHQAASRGEVNVAGRTGAGVAVLDPDAKGGADPAGVVASIREAAGDAIIAIVKTRRGYHVWLAVTESVGKPPISVKAERRMTDEVPQQKVAPQASIEAMRTSKKKRCSSGHTRATDRLP